MISRFNITGPCDGTNLLFRKENYMDTYILADDANTTVTMMKIGS